MKERLGPLLLPPLLLIALFLREAAGPGRPARGAAPAEATPFLDPESAWFARRVELALSAGRLPQADRFLSHPHATAVAEPPFFPAVLAWIAGALLGDAAGGEGEPPNEPRLEALLSQAGPLLGVLLVLAGYGTARRRGAGGGAGLVAAGVFAATGLPLALGAAGRLSLELWAALLLALQALPLRAAVSAEGSLDRLQGGMIAGLVTGLGLASTPLFAAPALGAWAALLAACYAAPEEGARDRARVGLLFCVAAILPAQLPLMDGPWQSAPPGPVAEWVHLSTALLIAGCAAFAVPLWRPARAFRRPVVAAGLAFAAAAGLVLLAILPGAPEALARPVRTAVQRFPAEVDGGEGGLGRGAALVALTPWLALLALAVGSARRALDPEGLHLAISAGLAALASLAYPPAALVALVPAVLAADLWLAGAWGALPRGLRRVGWMLALVGLGGGAVESALTFRGAAVERAAARERVRGLRWLREHSDPTGAWNAAGAGQDWGVLAEPELAGLVPYHARRPALGTSPRASGDANGRSRALEVLASAQTEELVRGAARLGARYLVLEPTARGPAARRLARGEAPPEGARRVYPTGHPSGSEAPPLSIFLLERAR